MPESLTRREFMKELGKLGAAAAIAPMVAVGEQSSDKVETLKRPSFIKEVDKPTIEIDWSQIKRHDERDNNRGGFVKYVGQDRLDKLIELQQNNLAKWLKEGRPGYTLKDQALKSAQDAGGVGYSFIGRGKAKTPEDWGVPKYTGTPEEASMIVTAALRHMGAATVGFVELDTNTTEKLIYRVDPDGKEIRIEDVDEPRDEEGEDFRVLPKKARWAVVYTIQMSEETLSTAPTVLGSQTTTLAYRRSQNIQQRFQEFMRGLGYMCLSESSLNALAIAPALGVMAGLGEMSRFNRMVTPEYGPMVRVFKAITDLPLAPTKPIDAGIMKFCESCTKCADHCPSKALSFEKEPYWETKGPWNVPGHKAWFEDAPKCRTYWYEVGTNCGICFAVCPFASKNVASYNRMRNALIGTVPAFNKTLKSLDDLLYTPYTEFGKPQKDPEKWWTLNLPEYGTDTMLTVRETS